MVQGYLGTGTSVLVVELGVLLVVFTFYAIFGQSAMDNYVSISKYCTFYPISFIYLAIVTIYVADSDFTYKIHD